MKFVELATYLEKLEKTSSRIEITKILAELFRKTDAFEIDKTVYLLLGSLAPNYEGVVFNVAEKMIIKAIALTYGYDGKAVNGLYKKAGDLGIVTETLAKKSHFTAHNSPLSITDVYQKLMDVARDSGEESVERKIQKISELFKNLDPRSTRFVARIPLGRLRLGFSDKTVIDALSWMEAGDKSLRSQLLKAYEVVPDIGFLAKRVKEVGAAIASKNIKPVVGIPVLPALAQRLNSPVEMIEKMGKVAVEPKFDGLRVLIHFSRSKKMLKAFTRNLNDVSEMFPELTNIGDYIKGYEVILDTEATGMDPEMIKIMNFQTTMKRRRIHDVNETAGQIPLRFQVFDILFKDGQSLMGTAYLQRRKVLSGTVKENDLMVVDEAVITEDPKVIERQYQKNIDKGLEGVVVKKVDSPYIPGRTGYRWVKMKDAEGSKAKLMDTIDCVVMGYMSGKGKRTQFGLGKILVGIMQGEKVRTLTKVGTGFTERILGEMKKRLDKISLNKKPDNYIVDKNLEPDVWTYPKLVVEIAADEITKSPNHSLGISLRFPKFIRFRDDKNPDQATTLKELKKLFEIQRV